MLEACNGVIAHLDVIISMAHVAVNAPESYVKPEILEMGVWTCTYTTDPFAHTIQALEVLF